MNDTHPRVELYVQFFRVSDSWFAVPRIQPPIDDKNRWYRLVVHVPEAELMPLAEALTMANVKDMTEDERRDVGGVAELASLRALIKELTGALGFLLNVLNARGGPHKSKRLKATALGKAALAKAREAAP